MAEAVEEVRQRAQVVSTRRAAQEGAQEGIVGNFPAVAR